MDAPVEQSQLIQMSVSTIITLASSITVALAGTIAILFRMLEKKNDAIVDLTKSFTEVTIGVKTALENNNRLIDKLPEAVLTQMRLNDK